MRGRRRSNDGPAYCLAKPHSLDTYLLSQQPLARQACRYSPHLARHLGEPLSVLAQKPWQVLTRSEQLFASAGAVSAKTSAAAAPSPAHMSESFRKSASQSAHNAGRLSG
jgi:hypothetical protein